MNDWMSTGDYNGDGKTDCRCRKQTATEQVGLSTGTDFTWSQWLGDWCEGGILTQGDFDGDGMTDLSCRNNTNYNVKVALSTGTSFSAATTWLTNWCRDDGGSSHGENWGTDAKVILPGDFNGDGNTDLLCRGTAGGGRGPWIALSDGTSLTHDGKWTDVDTPCGGQDLRGLADFSGDGKTDIYCYDNKSTGGGMNWDTQVGLSDGSDFHIGQWLGANTCDKIGFADVNGDARADVWCHKRGRLPQLGGALRRLLPVRELDALEKRLVRHQ